MSSNNEKLVFEKVKKEMNQFLVNRNCKPVDFEDSRMSFMQYRDLLDEMGFISLSKLRIEIVELFNKSWTYDLKCEDKVLGKIRSRNVLVFLCGVLKIKVNEIINKDVEKIAGEKRHIHFDSEGNAWYSSTSDIEAIHRKYIDLSSFRNSCKKQMPVADLRFDFVPHINRNSE